MMREAADMSEIVRGGGILHRFDQANQRFMMNSHSRMSNVRNALTCSMRLKGSSSIDKKGGRRADDHKWDDVDAMDETECRSMRNRNE